jgi:DMSO reductase anchor subunit
LRFRATIAALLGLFALLTLLDRFAPIEPLAVRGAMPLLVVAAEALAMIGFGALLRRAQRVDFPLDFLIGYPLLGAALYLAALVRVSAWALVPVLAIGVVAAIAFLLRWYAEEHVASEEMPIAAAWAGAFVFAAIVCLFFAPNDLSIARTWVLEGRAVALPLLDAYHAPLGIECADLLPLALLGPRGGAIASTLLHVLAVIAATMHLQSPPRASSPRTHSSRSQSSDGR